MKLSFKPLALFVTRRPGLVLAATLAVTLILGFGMSRIAVDADMTDDIPDTLPEKQFYDQVGEIFPADDFLIIAVTDSRGVFIPETLAQVKDWSDAFARMRGVKNVLSLSSAGLITGTDEGLFIREAMPFLPETPAQIAAFRETVEANDMTQGLLGEDGKSTALIITLREGLDAEPLPRVVLELPEGALGREGFREELTGLKGVWRILWGDREEDRREALSTFLEDLTGEEKTLILLEPEESVSLDDLAAAATPLAERAGGSVRASDAPAPFYDRAVALLSCLPRQTDGEVFVSGAKAVSGIVGKLLIKDLALLFPVVILIIALVLFISFRSLRGVLLPLGNVVISVVWAMGLMGLLGQPLSMATMILPIILIAVGTAYTIHVINRYYEELLHTEDKNAALQEAVTHVALPVFLAGVTTFIGFFSLVFSRIAALRMFGLLSALGILFALILSLTYTPALMSLLPAPRVRRNETQKDSRFGEILGRLGRSVASHPGRTAFLSGLVVVFFALFIPRVTFETNTINSFKRGSDVRKASTYLNDNFTGITVMTIITKVEEEGAILDPALLRAMDGLQTHLESLRLSGGVVTAPGDPGWETGTPIVGGSQSIVTFIKGINKALNADDPAYDKVPDDLTPQKVTTERYALTDDGILQEFDYDTREYLYDYYEGTDFRREGNFIYLDLYGVDRKIDPATGEAVDLIPGRLYAGQLVFQYENSGDPENIEAFLDNPRTTAKINVFIKTASSTLIGQVQQEARDYIAARFPPETSADITGLSNLTLAILRLLVESQISSVLASLIVVFLFISLMSRSFVEGLFSIIPLTSALVINFGLMGLARIPIDISTATIASIGIGIGIDYTLHFLERLKTSLCGRDYTRAVVHTMKTTGKGIFYNALAVAAGFSALLFSQLRGNMFMGLLMALIMLASSLFSVTLLPALLALIKPRFLRTRALDAACDDTAFIGGNSDTE